MKKYLLLFMAAPLFFSCQKAASPKETAQAFIEAVHKADLATAAGYVSSETRSVLDKAKNETRNTQTAEESFQLSTLTETINDNTASVKNEIVVVPMVKEEEGWRVALAEDLLHEIQNRESLLSTLKTKWEALLQSYEGRMAVAKDYITYKKSQGALSPQAKTLNDLLDSFAPANGWTRETLLAYVQKQKQLDKAIDGALEPSQAANTDLTMNYFLQLSNAGDRIKAAEGDYQLLAEKARSAVYVPLPFRASNSLQVNNN